MKKVLILILFTTAILLLMLTVILPAKAEPKHKNLLTNPGFEEGKHNPAGMPDGWSNWGNMDKTEYKWTDGEGRNTGKCIYLANAKARISIAQKEIALDPKKSYMLSAWVRTEKLRDDKIWIRAIVSSKEKKTEPEHFIVRCTASKEWKQFSVLIRDVPAESPVAIVVIQMREDSQGEAWVDDLTFSEAEIEPFESPYPVPNISGSRPKRELKATGFFRVTRLEGVWWLVLKQPQSVSRWQAATYAELMHHNNRPVQPLNARPILK